MTAAEAIGLGTRFLRSRKLRSPRLDTELLLATVLGKTRTFLIAYPETVLTDLQESQFRDWLLRRGRHYPVQYLLGKQEFYGHDFQVTPAVLIPRPETELLVDTSLNLLKDRHGSTLTVLDIGTGSGCVAISLCLADSRLSVTATDISPAALEVARSNAERLNCVERVTFCRSNLLPPRPAAGSRAPYDLIVSNPPYIDPTETETVDLGVQLFEPPNALFAAKRGMAIYEEIFTVSAPVLSKRGYLILELGQKPDEIIELSQPHSWRLEQVHKDLAGKPRCAVFSPPG